MPDASDSVQLTRDGGVAILTLNRPAVLNAIDAPMAERFLAQLQAIAASSGAEALALFEAGNFDAVFTDIGMPGMSGWELARTIRERDTQLPLAVITGWAAGNTTRVETWSLPAPRP